MKRLKVEDAYYYSEEFAKLVSIVESYPITMEQIVRVAECCGEIAL